jgi:poly(ADP-ribose) glycohydrolase ARH3
MPLSDEQLRDRFAGAILGTMVGDAIGAPVEGWDYGQLNAALNALATQSAPKRELNRAILGILAGSKGPVFYTDDTQMTFGVAESLAAKHGMDEADMAQRLAENFDANRGYGMGAQTVLRALRRGDAWQEPAAKLFGGKGSYGNGAAMRAAPIGLLYRDAVPSIRRTAAERSAIITHTHPLGIAGAVFQAHAVALAVQFDHATADFAPSEFLTGLSALLNDSDADGLYLQKIEQIARLLVSLPSASHVAQTLGNDISASLSVPAALYSFLAHWDSFAEAVLYAVRLGGDTDTIGAMCGAIAGAFHGASAIPPNWLAALENGAKGRDYAQRLADELFTVYQTMRDKGADFTRQSVP